jgi:hypothetical protein
MGSRLRRFLLSGCIASRREYPPYKVTREDIVGSVVRLLAAVVGVVALWGCATLLGFRPIGKSPIAWLVFALVMTVCLAIFRLRQDLKRERGIGWQGALITGVVTVLAVYLATALGH